MAVNPMAYSSKDVVLDVVRTERGRFYDVIDDPKNWNVDTRCEGWQVRDMVGHMIDVTEGYLTRWDLARNGELPEGRGWVVMASDLNKGALAFRSLPRDDIYSGSAVSILDRIHQQIEKGLLDVPWVHIEALER